MHDGLSEFIHYLELRPHRAGIVEENSIRYLLLLRRAHYTHGREHQSDDREPEDRRDKMHRFVHIIPAIGRNTREKLLIKHRALILIKGP